MIHRFRPSPTSQPFRILKHWGILITPICGLILAFHAKAAPKPDGVLRLSPRNPHYFEWRGQPVILVTSGEHYGAVLNLDFNFRKYLDTLAADRLNLTRVFTGGAYVEPAGAFNIAQNTLAPSPDRFLSPWITRDDPRPNTSGRRFDLTAWNPVYFQRLHDFVTYARTSGVVVEINLFCPFYEESQWRLSPFHPDNNINNFEKVARTNVYTLDQSGQLLRVQERMVQKFVSELSPYDNVYYEICNEPYFGGVTLEWQSHIADIIVETQKDHPAPKLISQNIANKSARIENPHRAISIFNFHYATPPEAVSMNFALGKVLGDNETGFRGTNNLPYRSEAWEFLLAGGALYNNLDYSFTSGHEDGSFLYPAAQPGGGNAHLRRELRILKEFLTSFDFVQMSPDPGFVVQVHPAKARTQVLSEPGQAYAVYVLPAVSQPTSVVIETKLPAGTYRAEWIDPKSGTNTPDQPFTHPGGNRNFQSPGFSEDLALKIARIPL